MNLQLSVVGVVLMPIFTVSTAILHPRQDPRACAVGASKMLLNSGVRNLCVRYCYCCSKYGSAVFFIDADSPDDALRAFGNVNVPISSILEAEEIKQVPQAK